MEEAELGELLDERDEREEPTDDGGEAERYTSSSPNFEAEKRVVSSSTVGWL